MTVPPDLSQAATKPSVLVLDAMGVIYTAGDDVKELLCPFIQARIPAFDPSTVEALYREASLGRISPCQFWESVGLTESIEDEYLALHRLTPGLLGFLTDAVKSFDSIWCLSNDLGNWSRKLRVHFGLERFFRVFVVSGEVGVRKPNRAIYEHLLNLVGCEPSSILFVDDRRANLDAAKAVGIHTILFDAAGTCDGTSHTPIRDLHELLTLPDHHPRSGGS